MKPERHFHLGAMMKVDAGTTKRAEPLDGRVQIGFAIEMVPHSSAAHTIAKIADHSGGFAAAT